MIIYLLFKLFHTLESALFSIIPTFEAPAWIANNLPEMLTRVASFNYYLPITEAVTVVLFLIGFVLSWKIVKIVLGVVNIDLNA